MGTETVVNIPGDLIATNILPRTPVRSVLRFKSVCKDWNITISSFDFAKSRLNSGSSFSQFLLLRQEGENCRIISLSYDECTNTLKDLVELQCQPLNEYQGLYTIVDSCNGLLCLNLVNIDAFAIWNPTTNQYEQISHYEGMIDNVDMTLQAEGFGYTSSTYDYKIFAMFSEPFHPQDVLFYLFSFKAGTWKELKLSKVTHFAQTIDAYSAVCINERLCWPRNNIETGHIVGLFCFDLVGEEMTRVWVSTSFSEYGYDRVTHLFEMDGCLSMSCCKNDEANHVWMFKGEDDLKSWIKLFSFDPKDMSILGYTNTGRYLAHHLGQFKLLDPTKEGSDHSQRGTDSDGNIVNSWHYVQSLASFRIHKHTHCADENEEEMTRVCEIIMG